MVRCAATPSPPSVRPLVRLLVLVGRVSEWCYTFISNIVIRFESPIEIGDWEKNTYCTMYSRIWHSLAIGVEVKMLFSNIIIDLFNFDSIIHVRSTLTAVDSQDSIGNRVTQFPSTYKKEEVAIAIQASPLPHQQQHHHRIKLLKHFRSTKFIYF